MVKVVWTEQAIMDLNDIGNFIAIDSERYAAEVIKSLFESTNLIENHPRAGRIVPEFNRLTIREIIIGRYRIVYHIVNLNRIDIITVHHSARELKHSKITRKRK